MDLQAAREAAGLSQRELAHRSGISQSTISRIEAGERDPMPGEEGMLLIALADQGVVESNGERASIEVEQPVVPKGATQGVRRVFVCLKCRERIFLPSTRPAGYVPDCASHGPMVRQANHPYMGQSTEPPAEWGWPKAVDGVERRDSAMRRARLAA